MHTLSKPFVRAFVVITAVVTMVTGVTFAALQSEVNILHGSTIQTAAAHLQLSTDGVGYANSLDGFNFNSLIPGGPAAPVGGYKLYMHNDGDTKLKVKLSAADGFISENGIDLSKVHVILMPSTGAGNNVILQDLIAANKTGGVALPNVAPLNPGQTVSFAMSVQMDADALSGSTATISNLDFVFDAETVIQ
ncbi:MAG: hypothetical protein JWN38_1183 [Candidatus Saccharibacteria bacterium]|nr:hypothetical protein [Candidatus Saccharibacteria bacterium]